MTLKRFLFVFVIVFVLGFFNFVFAGNKDIAISEVLFDPVGADTGLEYIVLKNSGASAVNMTGWELYPDGIGYFTFPEFSLNTGESVKIHLRASGANDANNLYYENASSNIANSSGSIALFSGIPRGKDTIISFVRYHKSGSGERKTWESAAADAGIWTAGNFIDISFFAEGVVLSVSRRQAEASKVSIPSEGGTANSRSIPEPKPFPFETFAGSDRNALAGAEVYFEGQVRGIEENLVSKTRFLWNFGDGTLGEGRNIKHIFQYPGIYIANLDVSFGSFSDSDSLKISVSESSIYVSEIKPGGWIEIKNDSAKITDVSGFGVQINDSKIFSFQKDTMLSGNSFLVLASLTLGLEIPDKGEVKILYPNGKILFSSKYESGILKENESINFDKENWKLGKATPGAKNSIQAKTMSGSKPISEKVPSQPIDQIKTTPKSSEENLASVVSPKNSNTNQSLWSEIKWLIFGLGAGIVAGSGYIILKRHFKPNPAL